MTLNIISCFVWCYFQHPYLLFRDTLPNAEIFEVQEKYTSASRRFETTCYTIDNRNETPNLISPSPFWKDATFCLEGHGDIIVSERFQCASRNVIEVPPHLTYHLNVLRYFLICPFWMCFSWTL